MGPKKRVTALVNSPKFKVLRSTPVKKAKKLVISRRGTPSGSKTSSSTNASPAPSADCLHELRFYPCDTPWHPHPEPAKRKLCPPCWLAQSKVWGLTGPEVGTTAECDRIPCKSCKKRGFGADVCSGSVGEDGRDPWADVEANVVKQNAEVQHTMVWIR